MIWTFNNKSLDFSGRPLLMGVVNITPDSFYDGGKYLHFHDAVSHALHLIEEGADIIDLGAESSRPGASPVSADEELHRLLPVLKKIREKTNIPISIDTYKPDVAEEALKQGADIINDISAARDSSYMLEVAARFGSPIVLMHMKGQPSNMQDKVDYTDLFVEVTEFLQGRIDIAKGMGVKMILADPGIGFGKYLEHNLDLMANLDILSDRLCVPIVLGASRKSFIEHLLGREKKDRLAASLAVAAWSVMNKVDILRVHDIKESKDVITVISKLKKMKYSDGKL